MRCPWLTCRRCVWVGGSARGWRRGGGEGEWEGSEAFCVGVCFCCSAAPSTAVGHKPYSRRARSMAARGMTDRWWTGQMQLLLLLPGTEGSVVWYHRVQQWQPAVASSAAAGAAAAALQCRLCGCGGAGSAVACSFVCKADKAPCVRQGSLLCGSGPACGCLTAGRDAPVAVAAQLPNLWVCLGFWGGVTGDRASGSVTHTQLQPSLTNAPPLPPAAAACACCCSPTSQTLPHRTRRMPTGRCA